METILFAYGSLAVTLGEALLALLLGLVGLALGWLLGAARRPLAEGRPGRARAQQLARSDDAFLKGITHLMADHTDQAIEEFTKAVTLNSDTVETYVVLGNLFRQKGEIERAVRIRQNIIARPNLDPAIKRQALFDLGLDYRKGGLYNRAAEIMAELLTADPSHVEALQQVVSLCEETRDWQNAFDALKRLDRLTKRDSRPILAHYKAERGKELMAEGELERAEEYLEQAIATHKDCLDAYLHLGDLELFRGRHKKALGIWRKAARLEPVHAHLVIARITAAEEALGQAAVDDFLGEIELGQATAATLLAMASYAHRRERDERALNLLDLAVQKTPGHLGAQRLRGQILLAQGGGPRALKAFGELLAVIDGELATYQCQQCGLTSPQLTWRCPRCQSWDRMMPAAPTR